MDQIINKLLNDGEKLNPEELLTVGFLIHQLGMMELKKKPKKQKSNGSSYDGSVIPIKTLIKMTA
jgi:hypothetical protein